MQGETARAGTVQSGEEKVQGLVSVCVNVVI